MVKPTVGIVAIAATLIAFLRCKPKQAAVFALCTVLCVGMFQIVLDKAVYPAQLNRQTAQRVNTPMLHWVMMGLQGDGLAVLISRCGGGPDLDIVGGVLLPPEAVLPGEIHHIVAGGLFIPASAGDSGKLFKIVEKSCGLQPFQNCHVRHFLPSESIVSSAGSHAPRNGTTAPARITEPMVTVTKPATVICGSR